MLSSRQIVILTAYSLLLWLLAMLSIRWMPQSLTDPVMGPLGFLISVPVGGLCVWLAVRIAGLARHQWVAGTAIGAMPAMLLDGLALRWMPHWYANDPEVIRLGAAWLLWGYGASLAVALIAARRGGESAH